ncbi:hypothetical protein Ancab_026605 [Ancistrocladus abbreviatus]
MVIQHNSRHQEAKHELDDLTVRHQPLPRWPNPDPTHQVVRVHHRVHRRIGDQRYREQRLRRLKPNVAHDHHCGVMEDKKRVDELQDLREVEDVGPEEERATWRGLGGWEAEDPVRLVVGDLGEGGEGASDGHEEREEEDGEVVEGGEETKDGGAERREGGMQVEV